MLSVTSFMEIRVLIYYFRFWNFETCQSRISLVLISMLNHLIRCVHQLKWGELRNQKRGNYPLYPVLSLVFKTNWLENKRKYPTFMLHASATVSTGQRKKLGLALCPTSYWGAWALWRVEGCACLGCHSGCRWLGLKVSIHGENIKNHLKIYYSLMLPFDIQACGQCKVLRIRYFLTCYLAQFR